MPFPVIKVSSVLPGSDSAASGAGPSTAITGTAASTNAAGTTVTLDAGTVLTGVAIDGSAVIYLADSTLGNRNFASISGTAGSGGATPTVTVNQAFGASLSGLSWAIGGMRATVNGTNSGKLFGNNGAAGDAMPGWTVEMQSGHTESTGQTLVFRRAGDTTSGPITLRGTPGAATLPILTYTVDASFMLLNVGYIHVSGFELQNSAATHAASTALSDAGSVPEQIIGIKIANSTNKWFKGISVSTYGVDIRDCEVANCANIGVSVTGGGGAVIRNCYIHNNTSHGIQLTSGSPLGVLIEGNIVSANGGDGIQVASGGADNRWTVNILGNTIDGNTSSGIEVTSAIHIKIVNNILSNNSAYGINLNNTTYTDAWAQASSIFIGNNTYNNTSGAYNSHTASYTNTTCPWASGDSGLNPSYSAPSSGNYTITNASLYGQAYPVGGSQYVGNTSITYSYSDPGAAQHQASGGGSSGVLFYPGMSGGMNS